MQEQSMAPRAGRAGNYPIAVREAEESDLDAVNEIVFTAARSWGLADRLERLAVPFLYYNARDLDHMTILVAETNSGGPAAVASLESVTSQQARSAVEEIALHGLYVSDCSQREGIGSFLLGVACRASAEFGFDRMTLRACRNAEAFFLRHGFTPLINTDSPDYPRHLSRSLGVRRSASPDVSR